MSGPTALALAAAAVAAALVRIEWRRPGRLRGVRVVAVTASVICLVVIALRPSRAAGVRAAVATVVTPGALSPGRGAVYSLGFTMRGAAAVPDLGWIARHAPVPASISVMGWGLEESQWPEEGSGPLPFGVEAALAPPPAGLVSVVWPPSLAIGEEVVVRGRVRPGGGPARLVLADASGTLDSVRVSGDEDSFTLRARPRATGHWHPTLTLDPARGIPPESLAIDVRPAPPFRVLLIESSPSFEIRFLRDWLAAQGAAVETRSRVSRGRSRITALNVRARDRFWAAALDSAGAAVLRGKPDAALGKDERRALDDAVHEHGLGLVLVGDSAPVAAPFGSEVLIRDDAGTPAVVAGPAGSGWVARTSGAGTAGWQLRGDSAGYAAFWARVLGAVRRTAQTAVTVEGSGPHFTDRPAMVVARGDAGARAVTVERAGAPLDTVYLAPTPGDSATRRGVFWPPRPGWYRLGGSAGTGLFVYDTSRWAALQARQRNEATLARVGPGSGPTMEAVREPVPLWPAYAGFVLAAGVLWWAQMGRGLLRGPSRLDVGQTGRRDERTEAGPCAQVGSPVA